MSFHKEMICIHRSYEALRTGSIKVLTGQRNVLAYGRFTKEEQIVVIINNSGESKEVVIPVMYVEVPPEGQMERLMYSYADGYTTRHEEYTVQEGNIALNMGAYSAAVLRTL